MPGAKSIWYKFCSLTKVNGFGLIIEKIILFLISLVLFLSIIFRV